MKRFEAYLIPGGEVEVYLPDEDRSFRLESAEGHTFSIELVDMLRELYPSMILAVETRFRLRNRTLYSMMKENRTLYAANIIHSVCSCCFGERDHVFDYDGERFHMERPKGCREAKHCPWNGYLERNKDSFMVICGAKREYGFTPQERRVALMVKAGIVKPEVIAEVMCITQQSVWKLLSAAYKKAGVDNMTELLVKIQHENI